MPDLIRHLVGEIAGQARNDNGRPAMTTAGGMGNEKRDILAE